MWTCQNSPHLYILENHPNVLSFLVNISDTQKCKVLIGPHWPSWSSDLLIPDILEHSNSVITFDVGTLVVKILLVYI